MELHVKVEGLTQLQQKLKDMPDELNRQERALMHTAVLMVRDEARQRIASPAGRATRGIQADVQDLLGYKIFGRIRSRNVAAVFSQKSRGSDRRMPSSKKIRRWLIRQGGDPTPQAAFLIARSIGRRGTTGHPIMRDAYNARSQQVTDLFLGALRDAVRKVAGG